MLSPDQLVSIESRWEKMLGQMLVDRDTVFEQYSTEVRKLLREMTRAYRVGDHESLLHAHSELELSGAWCRREPFRSKYEQAVCYSALYAALIGVDRLEFGPCYSLCGEVDLILQEKTMRRATLRLTEESEIYLKLLLLTVVSEAKWKGPTEFRDNFLTPEAVVARYEELTQQFLAIALPPGFSCQLADTSVGILLMVHRWLPEEIDCMNELAATWLGFSPLAVPDEFKESHAYLRYQAGLYFLDPQAAPTSLDALEERMKQTAFAETEGLELDQYLQSIEREMRWLKKSSHMSVLS